MSTAWAQPWVRPVEPKCLAAPRVRSVSSHQGVHADVVPFRKQLKEAARAERGQNDADHAAHERLKQERLSRWELTVGIEIHAQLNTDKKLFSRASAEYTDVPNAAVWPFDIALPGSQPLLQLPVLIPALRAAIALNCQIQGRSTFDRKHYFYHDQPQGYQITQYYQPFATNGRLLLTKQDGLPPQDGEQLEVGIKQIQLEQDTAKTQEQDAETNLIDFNRAGHALIEIISLPQIHSPEAAAAYVRKVQSILYAVDAATTGMERGGLRADVNVSVRRVGDATASHSYAGVSGLGQRTEIKNLSSFKSVEDAVRAERDRQIDILESGGTVDGETRGWSLSNPTVTRRLRGKEGEVDYRYMPDPDLAPLYLAADLVSYLRAQMPPVPDQLVALLSANYGLSTDDARALLLLDDGERLVYYQEVVACLGVPADEVQSRYGVAVGNWVLHEVGALLTTTETPWRPDLILPSSLAALVELHMNSKITGPAAKQLLRLLFDGDQRPVLEIVDRENLGFSPMTQGEYDGLVDAVITAHPAEADIVRQHGKHAQGKLNFLLGQMMRQADRNRIEAPKAQKLLRDRLQSSASQQP